MGGKGKVEHILFDPEDAEHIETLKKMRREWVENKGYATTRKAVEGWLKNKTESQTKGEIFTYLQRTKGEYSGFITVKPIAKKDINRNAGKTLFVHEIFVRPKFRDTKIISGHVTEEGVYKKKREKPLFLAAKLLRYAAKKHGLPISGGWLRDGGKQIYEKYGKVYDKGFFRTRGMKTQHRKD
ncbi:MAG: hypothetical protein J7L23_00725 [Candidatus Diapherotrites archaeon]|nr:hypothetical protein [Candidatus Diapherotrites archaeon]